MTNVILCESAELIRTKKVSQVELTKACLARIESLNPTLNCFITVTAESALAQARAAEADVTKGKWRGAVYCGPPPHEKFFVKSRAAKKNPHHGGSVDHHIADE